jgi:ribosomal-protein-serine acetyltransferase
MFILEWVMFRAPIRGDLELRLLEERHAATIFALVDQDREYLRKWLPWVDATHAEDDTLSFIRSMREQYAANESISAGIWQHGRFAGVIGTHKINWLLHKVELGYWLGEAFQGSGIMTDVCRAMITHLLGEMDLNRVEIHCATGNAKSIAIPRRLGFTLEGTLREAGFADGRFLDLHVFGMLRKEWPPIHAGERR